MEAAGGAPGDFRGALDLASGRLLEWSWSGAETDGASGPRVALAGELFGERAAAADPAGRIADRWRASGPECLTASAGTYAVALWDPVRRALHLARDASGAVPLHTHARAGRLLFASSLRALESHPLFVPALDPQGVGEFLFFCYVPAPASLYRDTQQVPAGARLTVAAGRSEIHVPPAPFESHEALSLDDACAILEPVLRGCVERCLPDDGRAVLLLSGGIDSTLLACLARELGADLHAVTAQYGTAELDESRHARAIAGHLEIPHEVVPLDVPRLAECAGRLPDILDSPLADPAAPAVAALFTAAGLAGRVVLDGSGADGLLGVHPPRHARLAAPFEAALPDVVRRWLSARLLRTPLHVLREAGDVLAYEDYADLLVNWPGWRRAVLPPGCDIERSAWFRAFRRLRRGSDLTRLHSRLYAGVWGPGAAVPKSAGPARHAGVRLRLPYEDPAFREAVQRLPRSVKLAAGGSKRVLRRMLESRLPPALYDRPKHSFDQPVAALLRHADGALLDVLDPEALARRGLLEPEPLRAALARFRAGDDADAMRLYCAVQLALFVRLRADARGAA